MDEFAEEKRPQTKSGIALKLKRCEKGKIKMPNNIKERRKALANLSANVTKDVSGHNPTVNVDERILDAAIDASHRSKIPD